jgi:hypothetical protein
VCEKECVSLLTNQTKNLVVLLHMPGSHVRIELDVTK